MGSDLLLVRTFLISIIRLMFNGPAICIHTYEFIYICIKQI